MATTTTNKVLASGNVISYADVATFLSTPVLTELQKGDQITFDTHPTGVGINDSTVWTAKAKGSITADNVYVIENSAFPTIQLFGGVAAESDFLGNFSVDVGASVAGGTVIATVSGVTGVVVGNSYGVASTDGSWDGLEMIAVEATAADTLKITFKNNTAASVAGFTESANVYVLGKQ